MSLQSYIQGERRGKEAHLLEKESMQDPFLQDAIDGYDQTTQNPVIQLKKLKKNINKKPRNFFFFIRLLGVAACILIIIFLGVAFYLSKYDDENVYDEVYFERPANDTTVNNNNNIDVEVIAETEDANQSAAVSVETEKPKVKKEVRQRYTNNRNVYRNQNFDDAYSYTLTDREIRNIISKNYPDENYSQNAKPVLGEKAYYDYIEKNRKKIDDDYCGQKHGRVIIMFKVNEKGRPFDISILRSLCREADKEAVRLIQNGPDWTSCNRYTRFEFVF